MSIMMGLRAMTGAALLALALPAAAGELVSLDDQALGEVSGREGIVVGLEVYYNAQKNSNAQLDGTAIGGTAGTPDGDCVVAPRPCTLAMQIAGRDYRLLNRVPVGGAGTYAAAGEWLMFKDSYFAVKMPELYLDGSFLGGTNGALSAGTAYETFFDEARFRGVPTVVGSPLSGPCLLSNGAGTACTIANVKAQPALSMYQRHGSDGAGTTSYNTTTGVSTGYDDISLSLKIGRMAIEYDTTASAVACPLAGAAACGYRQDAKGSFMGIHIRDNNTPFAGIAVGGKMYLYGF